MQEPFAMLDDQPPGGSGVRWGFKYMGLGIVLVLIALFIISTAIIAPFVAAYGENAPEALIASAVANVLWNIATIATVVWLVRRSGSTIADLGLTLRRLEGNRLVRLALFMLVTFVSMYVVIVVYGVAVDTLGWDFLEPDQQVDDDFYDSDLALGVLGIAIVFGAPFAEEIFFRGFLFGGLRGRISVPLAALLTGFIFSMAHYNPGLIIPFTLIGMVLALSYQRSGTLFAPIGAHLLFNLISFSVLVFVPDARPS